MYLKGRDAFLLRIVNPPRPVVSEHVSKHVRIAVEKILPRLGVMKVVLLVGPQEGVGELIECLPPSLERLSTHVDPDLLVHVRFALTAGLYPDRRRHGVPRDGDPSDGSRSYKRKPRGHVGHNSGN